MRNWDPVPSIRRAGPARATGIVVAGLLVLLSCAGCAGSTESAPTSDEAATLSGDGGDEGQTQPGATADDGASESDDPDGDSTDPAEPLSAGDLHDQYRSFDWESGNTETFEQDLGTFYGVDGQLARAVVSWAVSEDSVVDAIENVTARAEGTSGVLVLGGGGDPSARRLPFWSAGRADLIVSSGPGPDKVPDDLGPELAADVDWNLPEEGIVVLAHGTVSLFTADGTALGHLPASLMEEGSGSLIDWLAAGDRRVKPLPVGTGDHPCFETDLGAAGRAELCAREDGPIPSFKVDGVDLITEGHWSALYEEAGWSWEEATAQGGVSGHYLTADQDPTTGAWLLAWSGECESGDALLFHQDRLQHVTGQVWEGAPSAIPAGWAAGSAVYTTNTDAVHACGTPVVESAVYARPPDGQPTMIWSTTDTEAQALVFTSS